MSSVSSLRAKNKLVNFYYNLLANIDGKVTTEHQPGEFIFEQGEYIIPIQSEGLQVHNMEYDFGFRFKNRLSLFRVSPEAALHDVVEILCLDDKYSPNRISISIKDEKFVAFIHNKRIELENYYIDAKVNDVLDFIAGGVNKI
jgi:hypothetical protein